MGDFGPLCRASAYTQQLASHYATNPQDPPPPPSRVTKKKLGRFTTVLLTLPPIHI